jgi:Holliday junction resolvase RusA-like endonuclease
MKVFLELPYPPSANVIYRRNKFSTYLSKEGRAYKMAVADYISENNIPKFSDEAKLKVRFILRPRDKRKRDISNCIKIVEDAIQDAGVFSDDFMIEELSIKRGEVISGGLIIVTIEDIDEDEK